MLALHLLYERTGECVTRSRSDMDLDTPRSLNSCKVVVRDFAQSERLAVGNDRDPPPGSLQLREARLIFLIAIFTR